MASLRVPKLPPPPPPPPGKSRFFFPGLGPSRDSFFEPGSLVPRAKANFPYVMLDAFSSSLSLYPLLLIV